MTYEGGGAEDAQQCLDFLGIVKDRRTPPRDHSVVPNLRLGLTLCSRVQDVVYPVMNQRAMTYVGGGAEDAQQWLDFLGTVKDERTPPAGSPFQIDFPAGAAPGGMTAVHGDVPTCWDAALRCSCGDCPDGPQCAPVRLPGHIISEEPRGLRVGASSTAGWRSCGGQQRCWYSGTLRCAAPCLLSDSARLYGSPRGVLSRTLNGLSPNPSKCHRLES